MTFYLMICMKDTDVLLLLIIVTVMYQSIVEAGLPIEAVDDGLNNTELVTIRHDSVPTEAVDDGLCTELVTGRCDN